MSIRTVYTGSTVTFRVDTGLNLSTATSVAIRYESPVDKGEWQGQVDGSEITYTTEVDDVIVSGVWSFQAIVTVGEQVHKGKIASFVIQKALPVHE